MSGILAGELILWLIVAIVAIVIGVYIVNWLYHRSSKEVSFVRTGFLGERVVINGGAFVLPFIHDYTSGQHERVADGDRARQTGRRHHPRPHARRYRGGLLRPRAVDPRSRLDRRRDARTPHHGTRAAARIAFRQVRLRHPLGCFGDDHGADARAARRICRARQGRRRRSAGAERTRARVGRDHRPRPDRP